MSARSTRSTKSVRSIRSAKPVAPMKFLVTGASGYIAIHVIDVLLREGHSVRGTVRSLTNADKVEPIKKLAPKPEQLELIEADLFNAECWKDAVKDIDVVMHVASPCPSAPPEDEQELIKPAVEGTLNVLKACLGSSVKRVVVTSSVVSVSGMSPDKKEYTEADWTPLDQANSSAYQKSKILAEKAAWDLIEETKSKNEPVFELAVINPSLVMGPLLSPVFGASGMIFLNNFTSKDPIKNDCFPCCDVRDVASAHYKAAILPEAVGHRHIVMSETEWIPILRIREILSKEFNAKGYSVQTEPVLPDESPAKGVHLLNKRMVDVLKVKPTDFNKTMIDMANSFIDMKLV